MNESTTTPMDGAANGATDGATERARNVGDRFVFRSNHWSVAGRNGQTCEILEVYQGSLTHTRSYAVKFDDGVQTMAFERELVDQ